jgi:ferredoxin
MKIKINREGCVGHARCAAVSPEVYELDDAGYIVAKDFTVEPGQEKMARRGARACPERIILVVPEEDDPN